MTNEKVKEDLIQISMSYGRLYLEYEKIEQELSLIKKKRDELFEKLQYFKESENMIKESFINDGGTEEEYNLIYKEVVNDILSKKV